MYLKGNEDDVDFKDKGKDLMFFKIMQLRKWMLLLILVLVGEILQCVI